LPFAANAPLLARRAAAAFAVTADLDGQSDAVMIIASELVANAFVHGRSPIELVLDHDDGHITIGVHDGGSIPERIRQRTPDRAGGRGLQIVNALADTCVSERTADGVRVRATLRK
jgi:anti-sigma regulatory factor (Ser/Thr protein kinase)